MPQAMPQPGSTRQRTPRCHRPVRGAQRTLPGTLALVLLLCLTIFSGAAQACGASMLCAPAGTQPALAAPAMQSMAHACCHHAAATRVELTRPDCSQSNPASAEGTLVAEAHDPGSNPGLSLSKAHQVPATLPGGQPLAAPVLTTARTPLSHAPPGERSAPSLPLPLRI